MHLTSTAITTYAILITLLGFFWKTTITWKSEGWFSGMMLGCALPVVYATVLIVSVALARAGQVVGW